MTKIMEKEQEYTKKDVEAFIFVGQVERDNPLYHLCGQLKSAGMDMVFSSPSKSRSPAVITTTIRGREVLRSAASILETSPEYTALQLVHEQGANHSRSYLESFGKLQSLLHDSNPKIFDEDDKRKMTALFLRRKRKALIKKINFTRKTDISMNEDVNVVSGLKKIEQDFTVAPLRNSEQARLIQLIFDHYQIFERAVLSPQTSWN